MVMAHLFNLPHEVPDSLASRVYYKLSSSDVIIPQTGSATHVRICTALPVRNIIHPISFTIRYTTTAPCLPLHIFIVTQFSKACAILRGINQGMEMLSLCRLAQLPTTTELGMPA